MHSILDDRRQRRNTPLELLRETAEWQPLVRLIDTWARVPLTPAHGYATDELDRIEGVTGVTFHPVLREWWRLAGKHPLVIEIAEGDTYSFWLPDRDRPRAGAIIPVTTVDAQSGIEIGIHSDFAGDHDPPTHGHDPTTGPGAIPSSALYQGRYIATSLNVPALVQNTLIWHIALVNKGLLAEEAIRMQPHGAVAYRGPEPQWRVSMLADRGIDHDWVCQELGLREHSKDVMAGSIRTNGTDTIFHSSNYAFRTVQAFERFKAHVQPTGGICIGVETAHPDLRLYETDRKGIFRDAHTGLWERFEIEKRHPVTGRAMRDWAWRKVA